MVAADFQILSLVLNTVQKFVLFKIEEPHLVTDAALGLGIAYFLRHLQTFIIVFDGEGDILVFLVLVGSGDFMVDFN